MSKERKVRIRKCVVTNVKYQKEKLIRVVRVDGSAVVDLTGTVSGRGAYITPDADVIKKAKQKNAFTKALRMKVDEKIYDELLEIVR